MKRVLILCITLLPQLLNAQQEKSTRIAVKPGIVVVQGIKWQQILAKARAENKYIFVDCYTTWCGPCKKMDGEVYSLEKVGALYNDKFICLKIQMDSTKNDNEIVKSMYPDARFIEKRYNVQAYPTLLFFSPDGQIQRISVGGMEADDFIKLGTDVLDPQKNYSQLIVNFKEGKRNMAEMSYLARTALELIKDTAQSQEIAKAYLLCLRKEDWLKEDNIEFMREFTKSSKDIGFSLFYHKANSVNKIMEDDTYAQSVLHSIINDEIVRPAIKSADQRGRQPVWGKMFSVIKKKYGVYYADRVITAARINFAVKHHNWQDYTKYYVLYTDKYSMPSENRGHWVSFSFNNSAWAIFLHSFNKTELTHALSWSSRAVMMEPIPNWMDTYANILYKLGRQEEAIKWEQIALNLYPADKVIQGMLEKMKKGEPTWPLAKKEPM
ncbi:MAG: thioredoxin family protein [Sphingobacteriales bacterium]